MVGVSLFYLLSGFVMSWTDRPGDTAWLFYRRRFARIVPTYLVVAVLVLVWLASLERFQPADLMSLTLTQSWVPDSAIYFAGSAVFWSLSVEVFFYAVFPIVRKFTNRMSISGLTCLALASVAVTTAIAGYASALAGTVSTQWAFVVFPPVRLPEFLLGVALGALVARGWRPSIPVVVPVLLSGLAVYASMHATYVPSRYALTLVPFATLIVALAVRDINGNRTFASFRPLVTLGVWSYAFYLVHATVMEQARIYFREWDVPRTAGMLAIFATSVLIAWLLHVTIERPFEKALRPRGRDRLDAAPTPRQQRFRSLSRNR